MVHDVLVLAHVTAGALGLLIGPVAMVAATRGALHTTGGWAYQACCAVLCLSALALIVRDPALWPFGLIALGTQAAAVGAVLARRRRRPGWLPRHVRLALGSYVSFVTGFVVQAAGGLWWVVPVVLGSSAVAVTTARVADRGKQGRTPAVPLLG